MTLKVLSKLLCEVRCPFESDLFAATKIEADGFLFRRDRFIEKQQNVNPSEAAVLREFWISCRGEMGRINQMVGFNSNLFDLPFLIRRSWKHRVAMPLGIRRGRYWADEMIDLRDAWQMGDRQARGSLDTIAKHLGIGGKTGNGAEFAKLWQSDRTKAVEYLRNDLELTAKMADVLGVIG